MNSISTFTAYTCVVIELLYSCLPAQVFKSTTGEKLTEIQAHDDEVLCCAFSPDDRLLATCSSDKKVKVRRIVHHNQQQSGE